MANCQNWDNYNKCRYAFCDIETCKTCKEYKIKNQFFQKRNMVKKAVVDRLFGEGE